MAVGGSGNDDEDNTDDNDVCNGITITMMSASMRMKTMETKLDMPTKDDDNAGDDAESGHDDDDDDDVDIGRMASPMMAAIMKNTRIMMVMMMAIMTTDMATRTRQIDPLVPVRDSPRFARRRHSHELDDSQTSSVLVALQKQVKVWQHPVIDETTGATDYGAADVHGSAVPITQLIVS